jgi:hypothetical protein
LIEACCRLLNKKRLTAPPGHVVVTSRRRTLSGARVIQCARHRAKKGGCA